MEQVTPPVVLVMKPVDGGRAVIGIVECPHCGETHYTTQIRCGELQLFCGVGAQRPDGWSVVDVQRII